MFTTKLKHIEKAGMKMSIYNIPFGKINRICDYLKSSKLPTEEKRLLFSMRCRVNQMKTNYKSKYEDNMQCLLCSSNVEESEIHLLRCDGIICKKEVKDESQKIEYKDIFADLKKQIFAVKTWRKVENRKLSSNGRQEHLLSVSCADEDSTDSASLDADVSTNMLFYVYDRGY